MGFWGTFVVHRHEQLLWDLVPGLENHDVAELCHDDVATGWQVTRVFTELGQLPATFLADVAAATGAPVLAADILDSSGALVCTPDWRVWLNPRAAAGYLYPIAASPFDDEGNFLGEDWRDPDEERKTAEALRDMLAGTLTGDEAAAAAVAWAAEGGLRPGTVADVAAVLDSSEVFVEEQFFALLDRLGLHPVDTADGPAPPRLVDVLDGLVGDRLRAATQAPHPPVRGQRLADPDRPDLILRFDRGTVVACGCTDELLLRPLDGSTVDESPADPVVAEFIDATVTDVATVRDGPLPGVIGVQLRFGDRAMRLMAGPSMLQSRPDQPGNR